MRKINIRYLFLFLSLVFSFSVFAQHSNSRGSSGRTMDTNMGKSLGIKGDTTMSHKILLVPFESKMLMSEIDKDINTKTHQSYSEITAELREELDLAMFGALRRSCETIDLLTGRQRSDSMLAYIYSSTSYSYDIVPGTTPDAGSKDKNKTGRYINNGQLEVPVDYSARFMNINIVNTNLLANLSSRYGTDTYVFINQLDIKNVDNNSTNLSDETYQREITVHYSILDNTGHYVSKGVATTDFPYSVNDPKDIGARYFSVVARMIVKNYIQGLINDKNKHQKKK